MNCCVNWNNNCFRRRCNNLLLLLSSSSSIIIIGTSAVLTKTTTPSFLVSSSRRLLSTHRRPLESKNTVIPIMSNPITRENSGKKKTKMDGGNNQKRPMTQTSLFAAFQKPSSNMSATQVEDMNDTCSSTKDTANKNNISSPTASPVSKEQRKRSRDNAATNEEESCSIPPIIKSTTTSTTSAITTIKSKYKIYCDLDGVLVDFDKGVKKLIGRYPNEVSVPQLWSSIGKCSHFYRTLPWTRDGQQLWDTIRPYQPSILTGIPRIAGSSIDKYEWCKRELCMEVQHMDMAGPKSSHTRVYHTETNRKTKTKPQGSSPIHVITCWSKNKHYESRNPNCILIDDRLSLQAPWEKSGGIFIHHITTEQTIQQLHDKGIITTPK